MSMADAIKRTEWILLQRTSNQNMVFIVACIVFGTGNLCSLNQNQCICLSNEQQEAQCELSSTPMQEPDPLPPRQFILEKLQACSHVLKTLEVALKKTFFARKEL